MVELRWMRMGEVRNTGGQDKRTGAGGGVNA